MKKLCCSEFGTIYYATVDTKGRMRGNREDVTDDAVLAVMGYMLNKATEKKPFDGKAEVEINGFKLSIDCSGNKNFMEMYGGKHEL